MPFTNNAPKAFDGVVWCDRCKRAIDANSERDHFHGEQCVGCRKFKKLDFDWGYCKNNASVYCGRLMFEHDTCSAFIKGNWK
ncbi:MAG TPA: hypothetical protein VM452_13900 [Caulifigura sp.]|nr:hypothetical protein [Caulifigura sp.]